MQDCADVTLSECLQRDKYKEELAAHVASSEESGAVVDAAVDAPPALDGEGDEEPRLGRPGGPESDAPPPGSSMRWLMALLLLALGVGAVLAFNHIDRAPRWLMLAIVHLLHAHPDQVTRSEGGLSKLLQYKLDQRLSNAPSFKLLFLGGITWLLILVGGLALFVSGEESLYSAFW